MNKLIIATLVIGLLLAGCTKVQGDKLDIPQDSTKQVEKVPEPPVQATSLGQGDQKISEEDIALEDEAEKKELEEMISELE